MGGVDSTNDINEKGTGLETSQLCNVNRCHLQYLVGKKLALIATSEAANTSVLGDLCFFFFFGGM